MRPSLSLFSEKNQYVPTARKSNSFRIMEQQEQMHTVTCLMRSPLFYIVCFIIGVIALSRILHVPVITVRATGGPPERIRAVRKVPLPFRFQGSR